jgi:hypothetical protein
MLITLASLMSDVTLCPADPSGGLPVQVRRRGPGRDGVAGHLVQPARLGRRPLRIGCRPVQKSWRVRGSGVAHPRLCGQELGAGEGQGGVARRHQVQD